MHGTKRKKIEEQSSAMAHARLGHARKRKKKKNSPTMEGVRWWRKEMKKKKKLGGGGSWLEEPELGVEEEWPVWVIERRTRE